MRRGEPCREKHSGGLPVSDSCDRRSWLAFITSFLVQECREGRANPANVPGIAVVRAWFGLLSTTAGLHGEHSSTKRSPCVHRRDGELLPGRGALPAPGRGNRAQVAYVKLDVRSREVTACPQAVVRRSQRSWTPAPRRVHARSRRALAARGHRRDARRHHRRDGRTSTARPPRRRSPGLASAH